MQVPVHPQERFLIDIAGVLRRPEEIQRKPEHTLVIGLDKLLEGVLIALLRRLDQRGFI
jgi:hypothetical protein